MKSRLVQWGAVALMIGTLAGCGGGSGGDSSGVTTTTVASSSTTTVATGVAGTPVVVANNSAPATLASSAAWAALAPTIKIAGVSINSAPVVSFTVTDANGNPVVGLGNKTKSATATVASLANISFTLAKLVPGGNGEPNKWVNYVVTKPPTVAQLAAAPTVAWYGTFPAADNQGTLVETKNGLPVANGQGDGGYQYTFYRDIKQAAANVAGLTDDSVNKKADLGDVSFDPTLTHRLGIFISGNAPGTSTNTPNAVAFPATSIAVPLINNGNAWFDFRPDGGAITNTRVIVKIDSCSSCHDILNGRGIGHISVNHGNYIGRKDPNLCVTCHTDQTKYGFPVVTATTNADGSPAYSGPYYRVVTGTVPSGTEAAFIYPRMIHQTHMGDQLVKTGYNLNNHCNTATGANLAQCFNMVGLPQDQRDCTKCHNGGTQSSPLQAVQTANGDNWKNVPSMLACGACHDGINFATGKGITLANRDADVAAGKPVGTTQTGHLGGAKTDNVTCVLCHQAADITLYHQTTVATPNNPTVQAGVASFVYKIPTGGVTINASKQVVVKFQVLKDGAPVKFNAYAAGAVPLTGFTGGPSFIVAYATAQDGIAAPSDWNSGHDATPLVDLWAGVNGNSLTLTDAATNTYTAVLAASTAGTSSHTMAVPADAKMVTALLKDSWTQTGVTDRGGVVPGIPAMMAASGNTPDGKPNVARRVIFSEDKCNSCHDRLGTSPNFHNGNYSIAMCAACHTPNQGGSTGWSASFRVWVHGIHSASKRNVPFTWHAVSKTDNYSNLLYPGLLKDCNQCHLPGTYDFSASQYTDSLIGSMLNVQAATGKLNPASATNYVFPQLAPVGSGNYTYGLKVDNTTDYGTGNSMDKPTGKLIAQTTQANNLVSSPITAVCSACHDSAAAQGHFGANGGSFYKPRSAAITTTEQCMVCHGPGKILAIKDVHIN